jgi:sulfate adenylyltransferase
VRRRLSEGFGNPEVVSFPEVVKCAARTLRVQTKSFTVFFTGFSGSGDPPLPNADGKLMETGGRPVTLLDGDIVRKTYPPDERQRASRSERIRRISYVASRLQKRWYRDFAHLSRRHDR